MSHSLVRPLFNTEKCAVCHATEQRVLGLLQVSLSLDRTWEKLSGLRWRAALATLLTLGVVVIGIWVALTQFVDRPLKSLVEVMRRAEEGDLSARVETSTQDELGQLGERLNDMVAKLEVAQAELKEYHEEQLARADRLATLGQMAAAIAHEIRNPLTGISGAISVLGRGFAEDDPRREVVRQARPLIDRLNKAVEDILLFARPSKPQFQPVRLDEVIERSCALAASQADKAGVRVVCDDSGDGPLPTVEADPVQLQSVLVNLIVNAVHASASGGEVRIRLSSEPRDGGPPDAVITVADRGRGMSAEEVENAFKPFFTTKAQGTGLGLAIARTLVQQHQGTISIDSESGEGTRIEVRLPIGPRTPDEEA